ncbi:MAG TPA: GNAT family N-acetyltransferase [Woeseiaceae bacterium]|nr:GNAT family N-acetyltransferase [Woeseiaceae bacterium]
MAIIRIECKQEMTKPDKLSIKLEETSDKGRYYIPSENPQNEEAELTFRKSGKNTVVADHTGVPTRYRGQGIGLLLVKRLVDDARAKKIKIIPKCPFIAAMYAKHPEWADVMQGSPARH